MQVKNFRIIRRLGRGDNMKIFEFILEKFVLFLGFIIVIIPQIIGHYVFEIRDRIVNKFLKEDNNV